MFKIIMKKNQKVAFTHPKEFICLANEDDVERTIRAHGFIGEYILTEVPFLVSDKKVYRNKKDML